MPDSLAIGSLRSMLGAVSEKRKEAILPAAKGFAPDWPIHTRNFPVFSTGDFAIVLWMNERSGTYA